MAAVSAEGSTVCVLIRRLNSSCNRSIAFDVRIDFHWLFGKRVKVKRLSPASTRLAATAGHFSRHFRRTRKMPLQSRFLQAALFKKKHGSGRLPHLASAVKLQVKSVAQNCFRYTHLVQQGE